jgi:hypothetical protein
MAPTAGNAGAMAFLHNPEGHDGLDDQNYD